MWSLFAQGQKGEFLYCFKPHLARLHYRHHSLDLLSGRKLPGGIASFLESLHEIPLNATFAKPKVLHLLYELGHLFHGQADLVPGHLPLAIEIEYLKAKRIKLDDLWKHEVNPPRLKFLQVPTWDEYKLAFEKIHSELISGNCYQVNLTAPFYLSWKNDHRPSDFIRHLWSKPERISAYAHATWLSTMGKLLLSNSPECLVQRKVCESGVELYSMPIKGTQAIQKSPKAAWNELRQSKKDLGELNMITDLIRNDLSRVAKPQAQVISKQKALQVPGLMHQYSIVGCPVPESTSWGQVLECLFPGGSVTGAPKKRVLDIIHEVETETRGHYCGSTWLAYGKTLASSINIRTAELDMGQKEMKYGAGGGITLQSDESGEFEEMLRKSESFLSPFLPQNIRPRVV
ncbi:MAG: chorismate-binding protein [Bacteriovoracaceae bacterium]|nr:chorismate-binding protein [Bacteriovoracaceae bacterium]